MNDLFRKNPFLLLTGGLLCGFGLCSMDVPRFMAPAMLVAAALLYLFLLRNKKGRGNSTLHYMCVLIAASSLGLLAMHVHRPYTLSQNDNKKNCRAVALVTEATHGANNAIIKAHITAFTDERGNINKRPRNLKIYILSDEWYPAGSYISFQPRLEALDTLGNEEQSKGYMRYLQTQGIAAYQRLKAGSVILCGKEKGLTENATQLRDNLIIKVDKSSLSHSSAALVKALILGDRTGISPDRMQSFRKAGMSHLLALSGLHTGIVAALLALLLMPLKICGYKRLHLLLVIALVWCYALLTGMSVPVTRACVMLSFCLGALVLERKNALFNALAAAAFFILLVDPLQLYSPGFQLSFVAVGVILLANGINPADRNKHPFTYRALQLIIISIVAFCGTAPLIAYYFHILALGSLLPNLLSMLFMPVYISMSILYLIALCMGIDFSILAFLVETGSAWLVSLSEKTQALEGIWIDGTLATLAVAVVAAVLLWLRYRNVKTGTQLSL